MANPTTDFKAWTDTALRFPITDAGADAYWLSEAILQPDENTGEVFKCHRRGKAYMVTTGGVDEILFLTDKSHAAMLRYIESKYMDDMDPESWYGMVRAAAAD